MLTDRVRRTNADAARFVHWGATSQDVADTAMSLLLKRAEPILVADLRKLEKALHGLSDSHKNSVMLGRTLLQPARRQSRSDSRRPDGSARFAEAGGGCRKHLNYGGIPVRRSQRTLASLGDRGTAVASSSERRA